MLQLDAWAVIFHFPHHQYVVANAMTQQPCFCNGSINCRASCENYNVAACVPMQIVVVRIVRSAQRMIAVVSIKQIFSLPVYLGDTPAVVSDAIVQVKNYNAHFKHLCEADPQSSAAHPSSASCRRTRVEQRLRSRRSSRDLAGTRTSQPKDGHAGLRPPSH